MGLNFTAVVESRRPDDGRRHARRLRNISADKALRAGDCPA